MADSGDLRRELSAKSTERLAAFGGPHEMAASYWNVFQKAVQEPTVLPPGVYGVFADGWLGGRLTLAFQSGEESRVIRMVLSLPEWAPGGALSVRVEQDGATVQTYALAPGKTVTIEKPAGSAAGLIQVSCSPSFQPNLCGISDDTRSLTCKLQLAEISANGSHTALYNMEYGS